MQLIVQKKKKEKKEKKRKGVGVGGEGQNKEGNLGQGYFQTQSSITPGKVQEV